METSSIRSGTQSVAGKAGCGPGASQRSTTITTAPLWLLPPSQSQRLPFIASHKYRKVRTLAALSLRPMWDPLRKYAEFDSQGFYNAKRTNRLSPCFCTTPACVLDRCPVGPPRSGRPLSQPAEVPLPTQLLVHRYFPKRLNLLYTRNNASKPRPVYSFRLAVLFFQHNHRITVDWSAGLQTAEEAGYGSTHAIMPPMAIRTPMTDLSPMARPDIIQPRPTIVQVLTWPTTVLDTGPVWAMMKN